MHVYIIYIQIHGNMIYHENYFINIIIFNILYIGIKDFNSSKNSSLFEYFIKKAFVIFK